MLDGIDQLWVACITYVTIVGGFVYVAIILDVWSRRVVGYATSRSVDARLTFAAFTAAIEGRPLQVKGRIAVIGGRAGSGGIQGIFCGWVNAVAFRPEHPGQYPSRRPADWKSTWWQKPGSDEMLIAIANSLNGQAPWGRR